MSKTSSRCQIFTSWPKFEGSFLFFAAWRRTNYITGSHVRHSDSRALPFLTFQNFCSSWKYISCHLCIRRTYTKVPRKICKISLNSSGRSDYISLFITHQSTVLATKNITITSQKHGIDVKSTWYFPTDNTWQSPVKKKKESKWLHFLTTSSLSFVERAAEGAKHFSSVSFFLFLLWIVHLINCRSDTWNLWKR